MESLAMLRQSANSVIQPEEVEEYQGGDGFDGEFGIDEEVDADEEDKDEERSWKRE